MQPTYVTFSSTTTKLIFNCRCKHVTKLDRGNVRQQRRQLATVASGVESHFMPNEKYDRTVTTLRNTTLTPYFPKDLNAKYF